MESLTNVDVSQNTAIDASQFDRNQGDRLMYSGPSNVFGEVLAKDSSCITVGTKVRIINGK